MNLVELGLRNLSRNRRRTAISLAALTLCIGAMVTFRGFINGQQRVMLENFVHGQLGAVQVHHRGYLANVQGSPLQLDFADTPELRAKVLAVPGVKALSPRIVFGAMLSTPDVGDEPGKSTFLLATAIDPALELQVAPKRKDWIGEGAFLSSSHANEVVLNADFAKGMGAQVFPANKPLPPESTWPALLAGDRDGSLNGANVFVSGTQVSAAPGDKKVGLVPLKTAQDVLRMEGRVTEYAIAVDDLARADEVRDRLAATLGPEFEVHTWAQVFPFLHELIGNQEFIFGLVTLVFLIVVLLGIVNVMLMNVLERVREIGTMMAVGVRRRQIVSMFLIEGAVLGFVGALAGAVLGLVVVGVLNHHGVFIPAPGSKVDMVIRPFVEGRYLALILLLASVGSALASIYPSYRASKLRPVEALQKS